MRRGIDHAPRSGCLNVSTPQLLKGKAMSKTVVMKAGQTSILIESDESIEVPAHLRGVVVASEPGVPEGMEEVVDLERVERKFSEIKDLITACYNSLFEAIGGIGDRPDKFAVDFGVKLAGEAGVPMLTKASGEANFKVLIEWKKG
jgi:Trypsin-co-occurring domain 1